MLYPRYPEQINSVAPDKDIEEQTHAYDLLTRAGLYIVPKQKDKKIPLAQFWRKENRLHLSDRSEALALQRNDDVLGWCCVTGELSGRLVVVDLDTADMVNNGLDPVQEYERLQSLSKTAFVLGTAGNGAHLYYRVPPELPLPGNSKLMPGVDIRGEGGQVVTLGSFVTYTGKDAVKKGVEDGYTGKYRQLEGGKYDTVPFMSQELYDFLTKNTSVDSRGEQYAQTEEGSRRLEQHFNQPLEQQERLTLECLSYILANWPQDATYDQWLQMWMSAHHASGGSFKVRDYILSHPAIFWWDGDAGKRHFYTAWNTFQHREGGYTASSLFWLAKRNGWLSKTGYEIPEQLFEEINVRYISDWLREQDEIPPRLLLMSQTGSGKTQAIKELYHRLNCPKTVIFVPSIKLATELANTLKNYHGLPAELYRDTESGYTRDTPSLVQAPVLVTTLQTFARKVFLNGYLMQDYGLVVVEESDQLLAQFARGGSYSPIYGSHVREHEARGGYAVIKQALEQSGVVWFMDATMSQITLRVVQAYCDNWRLIRNTYIVPKSSVYFLESEDDAFQCILRALEEGKQVVAIADTAALAEEIVYTMEQLGHEGLLITRKTERYPSVIRFMEDVNKYSKEHKFICYNSAMGTGVSIYDVRPDVVVQFCGYLPPRINLQMLNRFRKQARVYCYYRNSENLYGRSAEQVLKEFDVKINIESDIVSVPFIDRNDNAALRGIVTAISVSDIELQKRSPREFYINLLKNDGRGVYFEGNFPSALVIKHTRAGIKAVKQDKIAYIAEHWREVPPLDSNEPVPPEYTDMQVALGQAHAYIAAVLRNNIPDADNKLIYDITKEFGKYGYALNSLVNQRTAMVRSENFLLDRGKSVTTFTNIVSLIKLVSVLRWLWGVDLRDITEDDVKQRCDVFIYELKRLADLYDSVIERKRHKFNAVYDKYDDNYKRSIAFSKIILSNIGLKQRTERGSLYYIENIARAELFLSWRNNTAVNTLLLTTDEIDSIILNRVFAVDKFSKMDSQQQEQVINMVASEVKTDFVTAVESVSSKSDF